jgi:hypothetical protein
MSFRKSITIPQILVEMQNLPRPIGSDVWQANILLLLKIISEVLDKEWGRAFDDIKCMLEGFQGKRPREFRAILEYQECLAHGHGLTRGGPASKPAGKPDFQRALECANGLRRATYFPSWLSVPLCVEAATHLASVEFYLNDYTVCRRTLEYAGRELEREREDPQFRIKGICDKHVTLMQWLLVVIAVEEASARRDFRGLEVSISHDFDTTTGMVVEALEQGTGHSRDYVDPLSKWIARKLTECKVDSEKHLRLAEELIEADRCEYFKALGKYLANRAFVDLLLFANLERHELADRCLRYYRLSADAVVDGFCNANKASYCVLPGIASRYLCDRHEESWDKEALISLARNLFYTLVLKVLMGERVEEERVALRELYAKDIARYKDSRVVVESIATAMRNLERVRIDDARFRALRTCEREIQGLVEASI